jgi:hypothetical protein
VNPLTTTVSASLDLVLAVGVFLLCRHARLNVLHAAVCVLFGFYLSATSFAPYISQLTQSLIKHL